MTLTDADMQAAIPTLRTERLVLRAPRMDDVEAYAAFVVSPRSAGVGGPFAASEAGAKWRSHWDHVALRGYGRFVITRAGEDRAIGTTGPYFPEDWPEPEIAWTLFEGEGEGIALEAATRARRFAYETLGWDTAVSLVMEDNHRSAALARRMGCRPDGVHRHAEFGAMPIWRHPAPSELAA